MHLKNSFEQPLTNFIFKCKVTLGEITNIGRINILKTSKIKYKGT